MFLSTVLFPDIRLTSCKGGSEGGIDIASSVFFFKLLVSAELLKLDRNQIWKIKFSYRFLSLKRAF